MSDSTPTTLITGGARMGLALGLALTRRGHAIALSAHGSRSVLDGVAEAIEADGGTARVIDADLRSPRACHDLVAAAAAWHGRLDVIVCLASRFDRTCFADLTPAAWQAQLAVDLDASFHCAQAAAGVMRRQRSGQIVLSADWVAASGRPRYAGYVPYFVAKAAVVALAEALALELAGDGIRVNAVAPGPIIPAAGTTPVEQAAVMAATPLGRWGGPEAVAHAVGALVDSAFVTGEVIRVDGGRHLA